MAYSYFMKNLFFFCFIFISSITHGQIPITIKSKNSNQPVSYANIWKSNKIFTSSDSLGLFFLDENSLKSKLKISAVGYITKDSIIIKESNTIYLEEDIIELKEVSLSKKLGNKNLKLGKIKNGDVGIVSEMKKETAQIGRFFANDSKEKLFLDKFKFKTLCSTKNRIVTILIYSVDNDGKPYQILNTENIICNLKKGHSTNEIDLNYLNMEFPSEGLFIVVNYLFIKQNKRYSETNKNWFYYEPSIDAESVNHYTDTWYNSNNEWKKNDKYSVSFQLTLTN